MIQIFFKTQEITEEEWLLTYAKIASITQSFPLPLMRIEAFDGYSKNLDKLNFDLYVNKNTPNECISFYTDWITMIDGVQTSFYKNWSLFIEKKLKSLPQNNSKPIYWFEPTIFKDDGSLPQANGCEFRQHYRDVEGPPFEYAIVAIAIMLENTLLNKTFLIADNYTFDEIEMVLNWLNNHFDVDYNLPIYWDKERLLHVLLPTYKNKKNLVERFEHIYRKQFFNNISFAIKHIGLKPALQFYAELLSTYNYNTYGFSKVLNAWMAATSDLESTLELIQISKKLLEENVNEERSKEKLSKYDWCDTLKMLLNNFVLWTPQQRELLENFPNNKSNIENGNEDIFDAMRIFTNSQINISPIYADETSLFEAFMYNDPKNGLKYKQIIEDWVANNQDAYGKLKQKLEESENDFIAKRLEQDEMQTLKDVSNYDLQVEETKQFINQYKPDEQYFIEKAIAINPCFVNIDFNIAKARDLLEKTITSEENKNAVLMMQEESKEEKLNYIKYRAKNLRLSLSLHPNFEQWLEEEDDDSILLNLRLLISLKFYTRCETYTRFRILWDKKYWEYWRSNL